MEYQSTQDQNLEGIRYKTDECQLSPSQCKDLSCQIHNKIYPHKEYISSKDCPNPEQCKIKSHNHYNLSEGSYQSEEKPKHVKGRIFGESEIRGGSDHLLENCVNPEECKYHKEAVKQQKGRPSILDRVKFGLIGIKEAILGTENQNTSSPFLEHEFDEIAQEEQIEKPAKEFETEAQKKSRNQELQNLGPQLQPVLYELPQEEFQQQLSQEVPVFPEQMQQQFIHEQPMRSGEENAILEPLRQESSLDPENMYREEFKERAPGLSGQGIQQRVPQYNISEVQQQPQISQTQFVQPVSNLQEVPPDLTDITEDNCPICLQERERVLMTNETIRTIPIQQTYVQRTEIHPTSMIGRNEAVNPKDIREADLYSENFPSSRVEANTLAGMPLTQQNVPVSEQYNQAKTLKPVHEEYSGLVHQAQQIGTTHTHALTPTEQLVGQTTSQMQSMNISQPSYSQQQLWRVPNECLYCRDESDQVSHQVHIDRGLIHSQSMPFERIVQQEVIETEPVVVQKTSSIPSNQPVKLPFGGTKPGQYMAQEIPVLYGWGAAPAQRLYKSNEVVGVNYTGAPVASKMKKSSQAKQSKVTGGILGSNVAPAQYNEPKLEEQYQGNINEKTAQTKNKVLQNVHEPIDSRITEQRMH